MREKVTGDAAARNRRIETPEPLTALRQLARNRPVLEEFRTVVEYAAELTFFDQNPGESHSRNATVVVPNHVGDARGLHGIDHGFGFRRGSPKRLFTHHHLAG